MAETAQEVVDAAPGGRAMLDLSALERISAGLAALTTEGQRLLEKADPTDKGDDKALRAFRKRCVEVRVAAQRVYDDGRIAGVLYEPSNGSQQALEGIQSLQLTALAKRLGPFRWKHDMVGYELTFDRGLGDAKSNLVLTDCKLDRWRLTPKDGGSVDVVVIAESSDTSAAT